MDYLHKMVANKPKGESVASFIRALVDSEEEQAKLVTRLYMNGYIVSLAYDTLSDLKWKE